MSKTLLKAAKKALEDNDPETALESVREIQREDSGSYFAVIFEGKAYQLLNEPERAIKAFRRAESLDSDNLLGWKGHFQVLKAQKDYEQLFDVATSLIERSVEQQSSAADVVKDLWDYLVKNKYKEDMRLWEVYLRRTIPGTPLTEMLGQGLGDPVENLRRLVDLVRTHESAAVSKALSSEKIKLPRVLSQENRAHLNAIAWEIYRDSDLAGLYDSFLNVCDDDELRLKYQELRLKYKYDLLKASPHKKQLAEEMWDLIEGMILTRTRSLFCWQLYFDWSDRDVANLDRSSMIFFIEHFRHEGLGMVLYGYLLSEQSPVPATEIIDKIDRKEGKDDKNEKKTEASSDDADDTEVPEDPEDPEETEAVGEMSPSEVLTLMLQGFARCSDSILANRIICGFYVHLHEYTEALDRCKAAIKLLADLQRATEVDLVRAREDILCSLAVTYTYHEAPKNFARALQIYDRILAQNGDYVQAKIGKALILIEKESLQEAKALLSEVVQQYPENSQALIDYSWSQVRLGDPEGREGLYRALKLVKGVDFHSRDVRALVHRRIAESYFPSFSNSSSAVDTAYHELISSLKESKNYAPSYTLLGMIYQDFYGDKPRAQKCFYKAFELDESELTAARYLVEDLTMRNEWAISEILCQRVVDSERARRIIYNKKIDDRCWPYRVLGCCCLNRQDDAKAIEWLQSALRVSPGDVESWNALGEAYLNCGRHDAAAKVFRHTLDHATWFSRHMLGRVLCEMQEYEEGLELLEQALELNKAEFILSALFESHVSYANKLVAGGFFGRAVDTNIAAIGYIARAAEINDDSQTLWRSLGDSLRIFLLVQEAIDKFPLAVVKKILSLDHHHDLQKDQRSISKLIILAAERALEHLPSKSHKQLRSAVHYNLGLAHLEAFQYRSTSSNEGSSEDESALHRSQAVQALKRAISIESHVASYWVALGNAFSTSNPQIAQHCFIKAVSLESRDAGIWINLAALYLRYGDASLAQEAFTRAQSVAPSQASSWLGNALTSQALGDEEMASRLFTHAFIVSNGRSPLSQLLYGLAVLDKRVKVGSNIRDIDTAQEFSIANYAMKSYLRFYPHDEEALEIAFVVSERCQDYESGVGYVERLCESLEKQYEHSESEVVLLKFARAKTRLARGYLGLGQLERALEQAQVTVALLEGEQGQDSEHQGEVISSRIVMGLVHFFSDDFDGALEQFRYVLERGDSSERLVTFTAQVLYAYGTEDTKQAAIDTLFNYISEHGSSLLVIFTLGAISIIDNLEEFLPAIKEELQGLSPQLLLEDSQRHVPTMIDEINKRLEVHETVWQRSAFLFPSEFHIWRQLSPQVALQVGSLSQAKVTAYDMAVTLRETQDMRNIQRSILLYPELGQW